MTFTARLFLTYFRHRRYLNEALGTSATIDKENFIRLFALGLFEVLLTLPLMIFNLIHNQLQKQIVVFWPGWEIAHAEISRVPRATADEWKAGGLWTILTVRVEQWTGFVLAVAFFLLFGLTRRKRAQYRNVFWKVMNPFGIRPDTDVVASSIAFKPGTVNNSESHEDTRRVSAS